MLTGALTAGMVSAGSEEARLQSRIVRFLQESFPSGQGPFGGNQAAFSGGQSPPPGDSQNYTPIPRDSSLARAVLTGGYCISLNLDYCDCGILPCEIAVANARLRSVWAL